VPPGLCVGHKGATAADVIEVAVGVYEVGDRLIAPTPQLVHHLRSVPDPACVETDQPLVGTQSPAVGERLDHGHVVVDHRKLVGNSVVWSLGLTGVDDPVGYVYRVQRTLAHGVPRLVRGDGVGSQENPEGPEVTVN
jgi:hypothetical protein